MTFYKDGTRKTVRLGTVAELPNEDEARRLADEVIRTGATDRPAIHDILHPPHPEPTFAQFVHERFLPEFVEQGNLSHAGKCHYTSILKGQLKINFTDSVQWCSSISVGWCCV